MSYRVVIHPDFASDCQKIRKKDPVRYEQIAKKIRILAENPETGRPMHPPLQGQWRVHIGHFVLFYEIDTREKTIVFLRFVHHDEAYH
jgi:addiction module RelE/StbE family toxin